MLSQEQLAAALIAFGEAVPVGTKLHSLKVTPSVGYADTEAKPVFVLVLADSDKDVHRLSQVISRGIKAFETEPGLTASLLRQHLQIDVLAEASGQMNEAFPPLVHTTQVRGDLEQDHPEAGDGKSSPAMDTEQKTRMTDAQRKEAVEAGAASAKAMLTQSSNPLLMLDELCDDELLTCHAIGWNSVCTSAENSRRWAEHSATSSY
ncbi:MAG: hypothetical protein ACNJA3_28525 (plasmid) [Pseudomonas rhizophila]|uniref:hypothetical protein n=1 Tax=Pseudomonas rhizophila TaxID=2045200 RepID=UPI003F6CDB18